jgi:molecular chaperone GrpE
MSKKEKIKKYEEVEKASSGVDEKKETANKKDANNQEGADEKADSKETLHEKLEAAQAESKENYDRLLRVSAEFDNYKKRTTREMDDLRKFANESILKEILPVVDNLERALASTDPVDGSAQCFIEGIQMTHKEILKVFSQFGVKPVEALDQTFDPLFHQAIMQEETDEKPDNTVIKEMMKGYLLHDRLLRPAMVVVSKAIEIAEDAQDNKSNDD